MRYLRMLSNALVAALFGVALLAVLVLQLNPRMPWQPGVVAGLMAVLAGSYGGVLAASFYLAFLVRATFARERLSPGWLSLRLLAWLCTLEAAAGAALMWANVGSFAPVLDAEAARRMALGASAVTVSAALLLVLAVLHYSFGRRGSRVGGSLFAMTVAAALVLPAVARGREVTDLPRPVALPQAQAAPSSTAAPRLHVVLLDGASLEYIVPATAGGRLPHFGRLLDTGASLHLGTIRPTQPAAVWTAAMTGKTPLQNGVRSAERYRFRGSGDEAIELLPDKCFAHALVRWGWLEAEGLTSLDLRAHPLWRIVSADGQRVTVVGLPLTAPVSPVNGVLIAEHFAAHAEGTLDTHETRVFPPELAARIAAPTPVVASPRAGTGPMLQLPTARDAWYRHVRRLLDEEPPPVLDLVRYDSLDVAGHHFLRYALPREFGDVSADERAQHGQAMARQYEVVDEELGHLMARLVPGDLLLVVSGFGIEAVSPARRILARVLGDRQLTGTHQGGPEGFLLAYGANVEPGRRRVGSVVDVAPTALYFLGLPVARDMDGETRTDLFRPEFTSNRPVTFIPTYDRR